MNFQKISGLAAIAAGATYIIGFWVYFSILGPAQYGSLAVPAADHVSFLVDNQALMTLWNQVIYVLNAVLMVVIVIGLHRRLTGSGAIAQTASAFGLIWAGLILATGMLENIAIGQIVRLAEVDMDSAVALWRSTSAVSAGLGGGNEITGGMWIFVLSLAGFQTKSLPLPVNVLGFVVGGAGILSTIPAFAAATMVFGLGFIVWFIVAGIALIVLKAPKPAESA
ncbi:MAG: hypothetical protein DHS20C06_16400 [Hyphobacterium sp.]|nr:MAG: hypothetical protein DHS20C06_16400 [Hyphobacterium sp.]